MRQLLPKELKEWMDTGKEFALVDVRELHERDAYNIGGTHIPMGEIVQRINELPRDKEVVFYCEKGIRSVIVIQRIEAAGFQNLLNLAGGMKAWKAIVLNQTD